MPILLLIRHDTNDFVKTGRLPGQHPNIHLNEEGRKQAEALGQYLKDRKITAVYASQLERAIETAWRVAMPHGLPIHINNQLADTDTGHFTARLMKELGEEEASKAIWKQIVETPSLGQLPGGESLLGMQARVVAALQHIIEAYPDPKPVETDDKNAEKKDLPPPALIAIVMHADPIKAAVAHFLGMPFDNFQRVGVAPASVTTVIIGNEGKMIHVANVNHVPY